MSLEMDQEVAQKLFLEGGTLVFLGVPEGTEFGIDMKSWNTAEDFRGVKMIPPGLHYVHYSSTNKTTGDISPRAGFMYSFQPKEFVVRIWDKEKGDISKDQISDESLQRLTDNLLNLDRYLAPYPYEIWFKWKDLSSLISDNLFKKLTPENGEIRSAVEFMPCNDRDRPRGIKKSNQGNNLKEKASASSSNMEVIEDNNMNVETILNSNECCNKISVDEKVSDRLNVAPNVIDVQKPTKRKIKPITSEEKEDAMLPHLEPVPGTALRLTPFPELNYPPGSSASDITKHCLDQTFVLEEMIKQHERPLDLIGEMQFTFICFLIGHSLDAFEHWKKLVTLFCSCEDAIKKHRNVYFHFIKALEIHIMETPEEFLADIVMNNNLVYKKLRDLFRTVLSCEIEGRLNSIIERFKMHLTERLLWDFSDLEEDDDDEKPVIVYLS